MTSQYPDTRDSLLLQVRDPGNRDAWERFARLYRPVIYRTARARGMQDADAHDLAQQVLMSVAAAIGTWERSGKGVRFRHWLRRVTRNAILNALTRRPSDRGAGGSGMLELIHDVPEADASTTRTIELEYRRELYLRAAEIVRGDVHPATWQAFEMTVVDGDRIETAAAQLQKTIGTIYAARSRVMQRLREIVRAMEESES